MRQETIDTKVQVREVLSAAGAPKGVLREGVAPVPRSGGGRCYRVF
jgi:hypothetical protein